MRSLDTLSLLRPKAESGRALSSEDPRAGAAPDFEAMLGALESGTAPTGEAAAEPAEAGTDTPAPPAVETEGVTTADTAGAALQALMALAGPGPVTPAVTSGADAGLDAMVQRAVARNGSGARHAPAEPAVQISRVGLETHFAPVRPPEVPPSMAADTGRAVEASATRIAQPAPEDGVRVPSRPRAATAPEATAPPPERTELLEAAIPPSTDAAPLPPSRGDTLDPAAEAVRPIPARGALPTASQPPVSEWPEAAVAPREPVFRAARPEARTDLATVPAAPPAPPMSPAPGHERPVAPVAQERPPAITAAMQAAVPESLRSPAGRGRTALGNDAAAPAGAPETAPALSDQPVPADVTAPPVAPRPVTAGQAQRDPEPSRARPAGLARSEPVAVRSVAATPRAEADTGGVSSGNAASDTAKAEAPRPDLPLAEPVPQAAASAPAPVPASPLRQIVDAVAAQLPTAPTAQTRPLPASPEAGPLKILTLQLHPAELGSVLVRMRLQDGRLEMSLRTSREETAERLRKEGDLLSGLLREAGYEPEAVTIQAGGGGPGEAGPRGQGFASFAGQGGQHDRQPGAATPDHSGRRPSPRADTAAIPTEEQDHEMDSRGRDRGDLYL